MDDPNLNPTEIEKEILEALEELDEIEEKEKEEETKEEESNIELLKEVEATINYFVRLKIEHDKLLPPEYLDRFKILLIGGKSWGQKSMRINTETDPFVYYTLTYKVGEVGSILDKSYNGHIAEVQKLRKMIVSTLINVWRDRFPVFTPQEIWMRKAKKSRKLFKTRFKKEASELFDLIELGRCSATYETKIVVTDRYTGHTETFVESGKYDPHYLSTPNKIILSEHIKMADSERFGLDVEDKEEMLNKQVDEFVEKENIEKQIDKGNKYNE